MNLHNGATENLGRLDNGLERKLGRLHDGLEKKLGSLHNGPAIGDSDVWTASARESNLKASFTWLICAVGLAHKLMVNRWGASSHNARPGTSSRLNSADAAMTLNL